MLKCTSLESVKIWNTLPPVDPEFYWLNIDHSVPIRSQSRILMCTNFAASLESVCRKHVIDTPKGFPSRFVWAGQRTKPMYLQVYNVETPILKTLRDFSCTSISLREYVWVVYQRYSLSIASYVLYRKPVTMSCYWRKLIWLSCPFSNQNVNVNSTNRSRLESPYIENLYLMWLEIMIWTTQLN